MSEPSIAAIVQGVAERELGRRGFHKADGAVLHCRPQAMLRKYGTGTLADRAEGAVALRVELLSPDGELVVRATISGRSEQPIDLAVGAQATVALEAAVTDAVARLSAVPAFAEAWAGSMALPAYAPAA